MLLTVNYPHFHWKKQQHLKSSMALWSHPGVSEIIQRQRGLCIQDWQTTVWRGVNKQKHAEFICFVLFVFPQCEYFQEECMWICQRSSRCCLAHFYGEAICCMRQGLSVHRRQETARFGLNAEYKSYVIQVKCRFASLKSIHTVGKSQHPHLSALRAKTFPVYSSWFQARKHLVSGVFT